MVAQDIGCRSARFAVRREGENAERRPAEKEKENDDDRLKRDCAVAHLSTIGLTQSSNRLVPEKQHSRRPSHHRQEK